MSEALARLSKFQFPGKLSEGTRLYFDRVSRFYSPQIASDMKAILQPSPDEQAWQRLSAIPDINAQLRTTCVATMIDGGHANNALPQRVRATVNCRILPGEQVQDVEKTLARTIADDKISIAPIGRVTASQGAPLVDDIMKPVEQIAASMWPGVPVIPIMSTGGTDGRFLNNMGIRTYGVSGIFNVLDSNAHGLNERLRAASLYEGQEFLYRLTKALSAGAGAITP